jgi:hypothetical protein
VSHVPQQPIRRAETSSVPTGDDHLWHLCRLLVVAFMAVAIVPLAGVGGSAVSVAVASAAPDDTVDPSQPRDQSAATNAAAQDRLDEVGNGDWSIGQRNRFDEVVVGASTAWWIVAESGVSVSSVRWDFGSPDVNGRQQAVVSQAGTAEEPAVEHVYEMVGPVTVTATVVVEVPPMTTSPAPIDAVCATAPGPDVAAERRWPVWSAPLNCEPPLVPSCFVGDTIVPPALDTATGRVQVPVRCQGPSVEIPAQQMEVEVSKAVEALAFPVTGTADAPAGGRSGTGNTARSGSREDPGAAAEGLIDYSTTRDPSGPNGSNSSDPGGPAGSGNQRSGSAGPGAAGGNGATNTPAGSTGSEPADGRGPSGTDVSAIAGGRDQPGLTTNPASPVLTLPPQPLVADDPRKYRRTVVVIDGKEVDLESLTSDELPPDPALRLGGADNVGEFWGYANQSFIDAGEGNDRLYFDGFVDGLTLELGQGFDTVELAEGFSGKIILNDPAHSTIDRRGNNLQHNDTVLLYGEGWVRRDDGSQHPTFVRLIGGEIVASLVLGSNNIENVVTAGGEVLFSEAPTRKRRRGLFGWIGNAISSVFRGIGNVIKGVGGAIASAGKWVWDNAGKYVWQVAKAAAPIVAMAFPVVAPIVAVATAGIGVVEAIACGCVLAGLTAAAGLIPGAGAVLQRGLQYWDAAKAFARGRILDGLIGAATATKGWVSSKFNGLIDGIVGGAGAVKSFVTGRPIDGLLGLIGTASSWVGTKTKAALDTISRGIRAVRTAFQTGNVFNGIRGYFGEESVVGQLTTAVEKVINRQPIAGIIAGLKATGRLIGGAYELTVNTLARGVELGRAALSGGFTAIKNFGAWLAQTTGLDTWAVAQWNRLIGRKEPRPVGPGDLLTPKIEAARAAREGLRRSRSSSGKLPPKPGVAPGAGPRLNDPLIGPRRTTRSQTARSLDELLAGIPVNRTVTSTPRASGGQDSARTLVINGRTYSEHELYAFVPPALPAAGAVAVPAAPVVLPAAAVAATFTITAVGIFAVGAAARAWWRERRNQEFRETLATGDIADFYGGIARTVRNDEGLLETFGRSVQGVAAGPQWGQAITILRNTLTSGEIETDPERAVELAAEAVMNFRRDRGLSVEWDPSVVDASLGQPPTTAPTVSRPSAPAVTQPHVAEPVPEPEIVDPIRAALNDEDLATWMDIRASILSGDGRYANSMSAFEDAMGFLVAARERFVDAQNAIDHLVAGRYLSIIAESKQRTVPDTVLEHLAWLAGYAHAQVSTQVIHAVSDELAVRRAEQAAAAEPAPDPVPTPVPDEYYEPFPDDASDDELLRRTRERVERRGEDDPIERTRRELERQWERENAAPETHDEPDDDEAEEREEEEDVDEGDGDERRDDQIEPPPDWWPSDEELDNAPPATGEEWYNRELDEMERRRNWERLERIFRNSPDGPEARLQNEESAAPATTNATAPPRPGGDGESERERLERLYNGPSASREGGTEGGGSGTPPPRPPRSGSTAPGDDDEESRSSEQQRSSEATNLIKKNADTNAWQRFFMKWGFGAGTIASVVMAAQMLGTTPPVFENLGLNRRAGERGERAIEQTEESIGLSTDAYRSQLALANANLAALEKGLLDSEFLETRLRTGLLQTAANQQYETARAAYLDFRAATERAVGERDQAKASRDGRIDALSTVHQSQEMEVMNTTSGLSAEEAEQYKADALARVAPFYEYIGVPTPTSVFYPSMAWISEDGRLGVPSNLAPALRAALERGGGILPNSLPAAAQAALADVASEQRRLTEAEALIEFGDDELRRLATEANQVAPLSASEIARLNAATRIADYNQVVESIASRFGGAVSLATDTTEIERLRDELRSVRAQIAELEAQSSNPSPEDSERLNDTNELLNRLLEQLPADPTNVPEPQSAPAPVPLGELLAPPRQLVPQR